MSNSGISYSRLHARELLQRLQAHYHFSETVQCQYYVSGLHDNYLIESAADKFVVRVYRNSWRTQEEIDFELHLLDYLRQHHFAAAAPIRTITGTLNCVLDFPEAQRCVAVFAFAPGMAPGKHLTPDQARQLGQHVARMHTLTDQYQSPARRIELDMPYLLHDSVRNIDSFLNAEQKTLLHTLFDQLQAQALLPPKQPPYFGIVSGDINPSNMHISADNQITLFDFDQCGYGYRAFEIAKFFSSIRHYPNAIELQDAFLDGYQTSRELQETEHASIPYFVIVSLIWVMALHAYNADYIGHHRLDDLFWKNKLDDLNQQAQRLLV